MELWYERTCHRDLESGPRHAPNSFVALSGAENTHETPMYLTSKSFCPAYLLSSIHYSPVVRIPPLLDKIPYLLGYTAWIYHFLLCIIAA